VALGIVSRLRPGWLAVGVGEAAGQLGIPLERVSRLVSRAITLFEQVLGTLTRRGRPTRDRNAQDRAAELGLMRELLAVASSLLGRARFDRNQLRVQVVGAWQRLRTLPSMTQARFCRALGLPERTLRAWLRSPPSTLRQPPPAAAPEPPQKPPRPRPPRRRRFGFDVTLPGTQVGADTTDVRAFGVPLKLVAAQDIGGRDSSLFESVIVDDQECADRVVEALTAALGDRPGAQAITDQGTPYMAEATRKALDELETEHAPQREADPMGKATVERAFRSIKDIARPLLAITDLIADIVPALRAVAIAKDATRLLIAALLKAYQHGARAACKADQERAGISPAELAELAEHSREHARATDRSARLLLAHIHCIYGLHGSVNRFINSFRHYDVSVLHDAERMLQSQMHRDDIRDRARYFAALVRRAHEDHLRRRARERIDHAADGQRARDRDAHRARLDAWRQNPESWLHHALDLLAMSWIPPARTLLAAGHGLGLAYLQASLLRLLALHGPDTAEQIATGVLHGWRLHALDRLGPAGTDAIADLFARELSAAKLRATAPVAHRQPSATLPLSGLFPRPPSSDRLRN
jgi:hypothetical protein